MYIIENALKVLINNLKFCYFHFYNKLRLLVLVSQMIDNMDLLLLISNCPQEQIEPSFFATIMQTCTVGFLMTLLKKPA